MTADGQHMLKTVTIVGGGTAGWMTAALLSRLFTGYTIRLIESEEIGTIGVGEATIPAIRNYCQLAGVDEAEMIHATQATFKLGIEFVNWKDGSNDNYIHGFGNIGSDLLWLHTHQFWLKYAGRAGVKSLDHYAINTAAARLNRFAQPDMSKPNSPLADIDYAYHFDASLFAAFLRKRAEAAGVERIEGRITDTALDPETGFVTQVTLTDGRSVDGDLFVDCSGMRGLLIGGALGVGYEDWNHWLLNDRALAVPCESVSPLTPYTRSTARDFGWQWRIPLQHRIGNGHIYSSAHLGDDEAASILLANLDGKPLADPRPVRFRPGKRHRSWEKNVVAIGLSSGFLEPLESTSIHMIQTAIFRMIALFPGSGFDPADIAEYNRQTDVEYADVRDFIVAHYKVTDREDTPYWAYLKHMSVPDTLADRIDLFKSSARFFTHGKAELFREESWVQVLIGQGLAARPDPMVDMIPEDHALGHLRDIEEVIAHAAGNMLDHEEFIRRIRGARQPAGAPAGTIVSRIG